MLTLITGGSGAIGSMCAYEAARLNYDIVLGYNSDEESALGVKSMLSDFPVKIVPVHADIQTREGRQALADAAEDMGGTDVLVNNAGAAKISAFLDTKEADTHRLISLNLSAHIDLTRLIIPQMLRRRTGAVVNVSSVWGVTGASCEVLYSSAKAGMIGFTKSLAKELAPDKITVNCVAPGCIRSKMLNGLCEADLCEKIPLGRLGDGLEVARAVFFLARHGYITGQTLSVDGGMAI